MGNAFLQQADYAYNAQSWLTDINDVNLDFNNPSNRDGGSGVAELLQENHYYAFGLEMNGAWNQQTNPEQNYLFTGFERQHDYGLNLDMAQFRTLDPATGRWLQIDPLAQEMSAWSPYNYGFDNPIKFIDPDGRMAVDVQVPDDIIIGNKDLNKRWEVFENLQKLTNDKLTMNSNGKVTIAEAGAANTNKTLTEGTHLVSDLINDNNTTTITLDKSRTNGTFAVNESTNTEIRALPQENFEYGANVYVDGTDPSTVNVDGNRGVENGAHVTLGHELNHARDLVTSSFDRKVLTPVFDFDQGKVTNKFTRREYNTRVFENKIRSEQGVIRRALPASFNILKF